MENERISYLYETGSIISHYGVQDLTAHIIEAGLTAFYLSKIHNLPGIAVFSYGRCYIHVLVLKMLLYGVVNRQTQVACKEILSCHIPAVNLKWVFVFGFT